MLKRAWRNKLKVMLNNHHERVTIFSNDKEIKIVRKTVKSPFSGGDDIEIWKSNFRAEKRSEKIWQYIHRKGKIEKNFTVRNVRNEQ